MKFDLLQKDPQSKARAGSITTDHGVIETPIFMPVGTVASVKGVHQRELKNDINPDIILGNTYHLVVRPSLEVMEQMGFPTYFLVVWDYIRFARDNGIPVGPGRGSAAGSLVAYALGITNIDPVKNGLLFERFLNPERKSMPDIDTDFCIIFHVSINRSFN